MFLPFEKPSETKAKKKIRAKRPQPNRNSHETDARAINRFEVNFFYGPEQRHVSCGEQRKKANSFLRSDKCQCPDILSVPRTCTNIIAPFSCIRIVRQSEAVRVARHHSTFLLVDVKRNKSLETCEQMHIINPYVSFDRATHSLRSESAQIAHEVTATSIRTVLLLPWRIAWKDVNCLEASVVPSNAHTHFLWVFPAIWKTAGTPPPRSACRCWNCENEIILQLLRRFTFSLHLLLRALPFESIYYRTRHTSISFPSWISFRSVRSLQLCIGIV